jgi:hypothetical protein
LLIASLFDAAVKGRDCCGGWAWPRLGIAAIKIELTRVIEERTFIFSCRMGSG